MARTLASGGSDDNIMLWDVATQAWKKTISAGGWVNSVAFDNTGNRLASNVSNAVSVWDVNPSDPGYGQAIPQLSLMSMSQTVSCVAFSPDGNTLAGSNYAFANVKLWDANPSDANYSNALLGLAGISAIYNGWPNNGTFNFVFSPDGTAIYEATEDGVARWNLSLTQQAPRGVVIANVTTEAPGPTPPLTVQVPVTLTAQGDENAVGGTITYDPTVLCNPQLALGSADANGMYAVYSPLPGQLEFIVSLNGGQTFAAGTDQIAMLTFTLVSNSYAGTTPLTFSNTPVTCEVVDSNAGYLTATWVNGSITVNGSPVAANDSYSTNVNTTLTVTAATGVLINDTSNNGNALTAVLPGGGSTGTTANGGSVTLNADGSFSYTPPHNSVKTDTFSYQAYDGTAYSNIATVTITIIAAGLEGDVAPRPDGNGVLDVADWVQEGRYVAGLETPAPYSTEYMRADVAPRMVGSVLTRGSGNPINVADWVEVGRYVLGLDPPTPVGGPDHDPPLVDAMRQAAPPAPRVATARALTIDAAILTCKKAGVVRLTLNALGNESAIGCTIHFDAKRLKFVSAKVVGAVRGRHLAGE